MLQPEKFHPSTAGTTAASQPAPLPLGQARPSQSNPQLMSQDVQVKVFSTAQKREAMRSIAARQYVYSFSILM